MDDFDRAFAAQYPRLFWWMVTLPADITRVWQRVYTAVLLVGCVLLWTTVTVLLIALAVTA